MILKRLTELLIMASACTAFAQDNTLTLDEAIALAAERNGTIATAKINYAIAQANTRFEYSNFLPTVSPEYSLLHDRTEFYTGALEGSDYTVSEDAGLTASYLLLDSGERRARYRRSELNRDAQQASTHQTVSNVLFDVQASFFDAARAFEQLAVQRAQVERAEEILESIRAGIAAGSIAEKDELQARADLLNARASMFAAEAQSETARANLAAIIGWSHGEELPPLEVEQALLPEEIAFTQAEAIQTGLQQRDDLRAQRIALDASDMDIRLAKLANSIQYALRFNHSRGFSGPFDSTNLGLVLTYPLYDGGASDANLDAVRLSKQADIEQYQQQVRNVTADIEATYSLLEQNLRRLEAAQLAREAAQLNYEAVSEAFRAGAADLIEILTAQVTLVTAETNYVQAYYDTRIAQAQLNLVTGGQMRGEEQVFGGQE